MKKIIILIAAILNISILLSSCCKQAHISSNNTAYMWKDNFAPGGGSSDMLYKMTPKESFCASVIEKTDYIVIKADPGKFNSTNLVSTQIPAGFRSDEKGNIYFPDTKYDPNGEKLVFEYQDYKIGLQALTIPFKFRNSLADKTMFPAQLETGVNLGLAAGYKYNFNWYTPSLNLWGKHLSTISLTAGPFLSGSGVDLKAASNAPGLIGDRKSFALSYGGFFLVSYGNIGIGYALGADRIIGSPSKNWVYNGKAWNGLIIALDILKF